jgi:hypothetical protein
VDVGVYYNGTVIDAPGGYNAITLTDPSVLDWTAQLPFSSTACFPNVDALVVASPDTDGLRPLVGPTTYLVKIFRPTDMTVLAEGNVTVKP